jgi:hypothetical protein
VPGLPEIPPLPGQAMALWYEFEQRAQGCVVARGTVRQEHGQGIPPTDTRFSRCFGSAMFGGLWVPPAALRELRPNQVLDDDRVTKVRTTYGGVQGNAAVVVERGQRDTVECWRERRRDQGDVRADGCGTGGQRWDEGRRGSSYHAEKNGERFRTGVATGEPSTTATESVAARLTTLIPER